MLAREITEKITFKGRRENSSLGERAKYIRTVISLVTASRLAGGCAKAVGGAYSRDYGKISGP